MTMPGRTTTLGILLIVLLSAGCTSTAKPRPAPVNPSLALMLDVQDGVSYAREYVYNLYKGSTAVVPFTVTRKVMGSPCNWSGNEAGNATHWYMFLDGIMMELSTYRYIELAVDVHYRDGQVYASHSNVMIRAISTTEINATYAAIEKVSIEPYLNVLSHDLFLKGDAAKVAMSDKYYLQSINMTLYHNTTSPHIPDTAAWEIGYHYIAKSDYSASTAYVVMDAVTGNVIKVEQPR